MTKSKSNAHILIKNTGWVYFGKLVSQVLGLIASILVIRKLDVDVYGTFSFLLGLFSVFQLFILSPVKDLLNRFIPELSMNNHMNALKRLAIYSTIISIILTGLMLACFAIFQGPIAKFFNINQFDLHFNAFMWYVITFGIKSMIEVIFTSLLLHKHSSTYNIFSYLARAILYFAFLPLLDVNLLLNIESIVSVVFIIFAVILIIRKYKTITNLKDTPYDGPPLTKRVLRYGSLSMMNELGAGVVGKTSDYYIISAMSNAYNVGLYGFALKIYDMFYKVLPVREFETVLRPLFFKKFTGENEGMGLNQMYNFIIKILLPIFLAPFVYFVVFGLPVINIVFDPKYADAYVITCISLLTNVIAGVFYPLPFVIQLKERVEISLISKVVVIFSLGAGILFMKWYGIVGVAIATMLGGLLKNLLMWYMARNLDNISIHRAVYSKTIIFSAILFIIFLPFSSFYNSLTGLIIGSLIFTITYACFIIIVNPFNKNDYDVLNKLLHTHPKISKLVLKMESVTSKLVTLRKRLFSL